MNDNTMKKPLKNNKTIVFVSVLAAILIVVNLVLDLLPYSFTNYDITQYGVYTPSDKTISFLSTMESETLIYVLDADGSDVKYENYLRNLDSRSDKIKLKWVDSTDKDVKSILEEKGVEFKEDTVLPYFLLAVGSQRTDMLSYAGQNYYLMSNTETLETLYYICANIENMPSTYQYLQYGVIYPDVYEKLNLALQQLYSSASASNPTTASSFLTLLEALYSAPKFFSADTTICGLVEYVNVKEIPRPYVLTGHGETEFAKTTLGEFLQWWATSKNIRSYEKLDTTSVTEIPSDAASIFIFDPSTDISKDEANMLIEFIKDGGSITVMTSEGDLDKKNLMSVLSFVGLSATKGSVGEIVTVKSENTEDEEDADSEGEEETTEEVRSDGVVEGLPNYDHACLTYMKSYPDTIPYFVGANSIEMDNEKNKDFTLSAMFTTSDKSYIGDDVKNLDKHTVAASAENKKSGAKVIWYTGANSFKGVVDYDDEESVTVIKANCRSVQGTLDWVDYSYDSNAPNEMPKAYDAQTFSVDESNYVIFPIAVGIFVLVLIVAGVIIIYKRKKS